MKVACRIETGEASRVGRGTPRKTRRKGNSGHIRPRRNAERRPSTYSGRLELVERRDASPVECRGTFTTGSQRGGPGRQGVRVQADAGMSRNRQELTATSRAETNRS